MPLSDLDLYLAHAFRSHPTVWRQLASRGVDPIQAEHTFRRVRERETHRAEVDWTLAAYTDRFGPPSEVSEGSFRWRLIVRVEPVRTDHGLFLILFQVV